MSNPQVISTDLVKNIRKRDQMFRTSTSFFLLLLLAVCMVTLSPVMRPAKASPTTLIVPDDYSTIQAALDAAAAGDTVFVRNGTYNEHLGIAKPLFLVGENPNGTIIDAGRVGGWVLYVSADNVTVSNFTIRSQVPTRNIGIQIGNGCNLSNNVIVNNSWGVIMGGNSNTFSGNTVIDNEYYGMELSSASGNLISRNVVRNTMLIENSVGNVVTENDCDEIFLSFSSDNNTLTGNNMSNGLFVYDSKGTSATNNTVNGRPLAYFENVSNQIIEDAGEVLLIDCHDMRIENLDSSGASIPILLENTNNTEITMNNGVCIELLGAFNNSITNNTLTNSYDGIYLYNSRNNRIVENNITGNGYGIRLLGATDNFIEANNISANEDGISGQVSANNVICQNEISGNTNAGIQLINSNNSEVIRNCLSHNKLGIYAGYSSENNVLAFNNITENTLSGITIGERAPESGPERGGCTDNYVLANNLVNNVRGIQLIYSSNISIFHNNFEQNNEQFFIYYSSGNQWDNGYPTGGNYWSDYNGTDSDSDGIGDTPYVIDSNSIDNYPLIDQYPWTPRDDIGIAGIAFSKSIVGQGYNLYINVTATYQGDYIEDFDVTLYANATVVGAQTVHRMISGTSNLLAFTCNTTEFAYGDFVLTAYASPVPSETNTSNNNFICEFTIHIGVPGDVSGSTEGVYDGICNMRDIQYLILLFNSKPNSTNWNPNADINNDDVVNMRDIQIAILNFNKNE